MQDVDGNKFGRSMEPVDIGGNSLRSGHSTESADLDSNRSECSTELVMCRLWPEAKSQAKPSQAKLSLTFGLRRLLARPGILESQSRWPGPRLLYLRNLTSDNFFFNIFTKVFVFRYIQTKF